MSGNIVPTAIFQPQPSTTYNIFPTIKYYIATGSYTPGEIISVQSIGLTQPVDFTGSAYSSMTFLHNSFGKYVLQPPPVAKTFRQRVFAAKLQVNLALRLPLLGTDISSNGNTNGSAGDGLIREAELASALQKAFLTWMQSLKV